MCETTAMLEAEPCPDIVVYMTLDTTQVGHELVTDSVDYDPRCEP